MLPVFSWFSVERVIRKGWARIYLDVHSVWIILFPGTVHDSDLHEITSVLIKVSPGCTISGDIPPYIQ